MPFMLLRIKCGRSPRSKCRPNRCCIRWRKSSVAFLKESSFRRSSLDRKSGNFVQPLLRGSISFFSSNQSSVRRSSHHAGFFNLFDWCNKCVTAKINWLRKEYGRETDTSSNGSACKESKVARSFSWNEFATCTQLSAWRISKKNRLTALMSHVEKLRLICPNTKSGKRSGREYLSCIKIWFAQSFADFVRILRNLSKASIYCLSFMV